MVAPPMNEPVKPNDYNNKEISELEHQGSNCQGCGGNRVRRRPRAKGGSRRSAPTTPLQPFRFSRLNVLRFPLRFYLKKIF